MLTESNAPMRFLILDDEPDQVAAMSANLLNAWRKSRDLFGSSEPEIRGMNDVSDALALIGGDRFPFDLVLADLFMPVRAGGEPHEYGGAHRLYEALKEKPFGYRRPLLVITTNRRKDAEELIREIHDASYEEHLDWVTYLEKPKNAPGPIGVADLLDVGLWTGFLLDCVRAAHDLDFRRTFILSKLDEVLSFSPALRTLKNNATRHRNQRIILLIGETGSGKERVARYIHDSSNRTRYPFEALNVSSLPANLIEAEVFGAEKGSYTGCDRRRIGVFERAIRGTVFLDEFGKDEENTRRLCDKLARVMTEPRQFRRIGGGEDLTFCGTLILGGSWLLELITRAGREPGWADFFSRVSGKPTLTVPALREHPGDIVPLARFFLRRNCERLSRTPKELDPSAEGRLIQYEWPGNIRELENVMDTAAALDPIKLAADELDGIMPGGQRSSIVRANLANAAEVLAVLKRFCGNRAATAQYFGKSDKSLRDWISKHKAADAGFAANCPLPTRGRGRRKNTE